jgi:hypothetical protein
MIMEKTAKSIKWSCLTAFALLVAGCATVPLNPGAQNVQIVNAPVPKHQCQLVGFVIAKTTDSFPLDVSTITKNEANAIRNAGQSLNANVVALSRHRTFYVYDDQQYKRVILGRAYVCRGLMFNNAS